eukprot:TRINITY_DN1304_c0_g1_i1.p1 TRINITY_DN1304_c0_g1~~TRINITY_DN1304_c0_g1_i1.p1  ORF type:complete len:233 (+),score=46.84 TRINITY_DN1304_c0_g1_i1:44-742(+)
MASKNPLKLLTAKDDPSSGKILLTAKYAGVAIEIPAGFKFGDANGCDNKSPNFLRNGHPLGMVPVLETEEGALFESGAITKYIARLGREAGLLGTTTFHEAQCDQWLDFASQEILPAVTALVAPRVGSANSDAEFEETSRLRIKEVFAGLNTWLETRTFFVGERVTVADIALVDVILPLYQYVLNPEFLVPFPHLSRWFNTCMLQPNFIEVLKPGKLLTTKAAAGKPAKGKK